MSTQKRKKLKEKKCWESKNCNRESRWKNMENNKLFEHIHKERILSKNLLGEWIKKNYKKIKKDTKNWCRRRSRRDNRRLSWKRWILKNLIRLIWQNYFQRVSLENQDTKRCGKRKPKKQQIKNNFQWIKRKRQYHLKDVNRQTLVSIDKTLERMLKRYSTICEIRRKNKSKKN